MKTCGDCKFFDVSVGPSGGKLRHENAPGYCTYVIQWPKFPISIQVDSWTNMVKLPTKEKVNRSKNAENCPCFSGKGISGSNLFFP